MRRPGPSGSRQYSSKCQTLGLRSDGDPATPPDALPGDAPAGAASPCSERLPWTLTEAILMLPEQHRCTLYALHAADADVCRLAVRALLALDLGLTEGRIARAREAVRDLASQGVNPSSRASEAS